MNRADKEAMERLQEDVRQRRNPRWREHLERHRQMLRPEGEKQPELEQKRKDE